MRFERTEAYALDIFKAVKAFNRIEDIGSVTEIPAVAHEVNAREHDLGIALLIQLFGFIPHGFEPS